MNFIQRKNHFKTGSPCALLLIHCIRSWKENAPFSRKKLEDAVASNAVAFLGTRNAKETLERWADRGELASTLLNLRDMKWLHIVSRGERAVDTVYQRGPNFGKSPAKNNS